MLERRLDINFDEHKILLLHQQSTYREMRQANDLDASDLHGRTCWDRLG